MDRDHEVQESHMINLYCSDYIRESIEAAATHRENKKSKDEPKNHTRKELDLSEPNGQRTSYMANFLDQMSTKALRSGTVLTNMQQEAHASKIKEEALAPIY